MYSREQIEQVRSSIDIVEAIRAYVPSLKVMGRSVRGLCPFHHEKTPSFFVQPEKGLFKCFGCGESGDVIAFVSKLEQAGFSETLERLAAQAGVALQKTGGQPRREEEGIREKLFRLLEAATAFYEEQLWSDKLGQNARAYLAKRGITDDTTQHFRLGYAPEKGTSAFEALVKKGFSIDLCQKAGLVTRSEKGRYYDPMYGRVIFPILDHFGHVVGFGGRLLPQTKKSVLDWDDKRDGSEAPKYLNSPETPLFSKGKLLYGLYHAKPNVMSQRRVLILEGYMDVIGAHQGGFPIATATLGTALTRDHAKLIKRYADEVVAFFDPDEAGKKAALRGLVPILQEQLFPKVVMPEGKEDPDEIILNQGAEAFQNLIETAPDFVDYILRTSLTKDLSLKERSELAAQLLGIIAESPNEILKSEWTGRVATELGIQTESLEKELKKKTGGYKLPQQAPPVRVQPKRTLKIPSAQEEYLHLILNTPQTWNDLGLDMVDFDDAQFKRLFAIIQKQLKETGKLSHPAIHDELPQTDKEWFLNFTLEERQFSDPQNRRDELIRDIRMVNKRRRLATLSRKIAQSQASAEERNEYLGLLKAIKGSSSSLETTAVQQ